MGKGGSRYGAGRPASRPQAESYRRLDIRRMAKTGQIKSGHYFGWYWRNEAGETMANVSCKVSDYVEAENAFLTVSYRWHYGGAKEWQSVEKHIPLTTTPAILEANAIGLTAPAASIAPPCCLSWATFCAAPNARA